jgi:adenylosuccinate lyase
MIERYSTPEMRAIWEPQHRFGIMLEIELLACEAMERAGDVPKGTAAACRKAASSLVPDKFPIARIDELEVTLKHDVIAFLTAVNEVVGEPGRHLHKGMTSSDVLDTTLAVQLEESGALLLSELDKVLTILERRAREHKDTICIGRSHGIHAEPTTFGIKLAILWDELRRGKVRLERATHEVSVGKISGAVGTFAHLDPAIEASVTRALGLTAAPASNQIVQRDRHAHFFHCLALLATSIEKIATELRHLQRTEVRETEEAFTAGQKGSSAMPHKRNPILSENLSGLARLVRGYADAAMDDVVLWHERDISHSSVERVIAPDATVTLHFMLRRLGKLLDGLVVYPERMRANLEITGGIFAAQRVMLALVDAGMAREDAYSLVQKHSMQSWERQAPLVDLLAQDPSVTSRVDENALRGLTDPKWFVRRVDVIFERVFGR